MKANLSLGLKLSVGVSLIVLIVLASLSSYVVQRLEHDYLQYLEAQANSLAEVIGLYSLEAIIIRDYAFLQSSMNRLISQRTNEIKRLSFLDETQSQVLALERNPSEDEESIVIRAPISGYGQAWGYLEMEFYLTSLHQAIRSTRRYIMVASLLAVASTVILCLWLTHKLVLPIRNLSYAALRLAEGKLDKGITINTQDEAGMLATAMETMRVRFRQFMSEAVCKAMAWEGDLRFLSLPQLLLLLRLTKRSGGLILNSLKDTAVIYIDKGEIVGARYKTQQGVSALNSIFLWEKGKFKFSPDMSWDGAVITDNWYSLILGAARQVHSLAVIERFVPSPEYIPVPQGLVDPDVLPEELLLDRELELFNVLDGSKNARNLAKELGWTVQEVVRYLFRFAVVGFIESDDPKLTFSQQDLTNVYPLWKHVSLTKGE